MGLLQWTDLLLGSSGQRDSFGAPPPWGALGSGTPSRHCHIDGEQWAVGLLQCTATLGAVGGGTSSTHNHTTGEHRAVDLL